MESTELEQLVLDILQDQLPEPLEEGMEITESTRIVEGLGLESADGLFFGAILGDQIGINLLKDNQNLFYEPGSSRDRTVGQLISQIQGLIAAEDKK